MRPVQYFTPEYLERCRAMKPEQIVRFLDDFRSLQRRPPRAKSKLISIKVPEPLLDAFKARCEADGEPYQARIKRLMQAWLDGADARP